MAKGFKHGAGSGPGGSGAGLTIVGGTTRPAKAAQNMIWINTDVEITAYVLSATEPAKPVEGMAWITIGNSGITKLASPIGDEWITVYPLSASQYVGGAWVDKEAKSYQGGVWVDWVVYLFNQGDECTSITGGWSSSGYSFSGYALQNMYVNGNVLVIDRNGDYIAGGGTQSPIDLTNVDTLKLDVSAFSGSILAVGFTESKAVSFVAELEVNGTGIFTMDTSNLSGNYYLTMLFGADNGHAEISVVCMRR